MPTLNTPPRVIGIAADDLTGANDSLVQFAGVGWVFRLALGGLTAPGAGSALAAVTDARSLSAADAQAVTADAVRHLIDAGADHLYLKIDSTMRGSIPGQIDGALSVWRSQHPGAFAVACPAYPAMGRTVETGMLRVNGEPVESTSAGRDPVTPVTTSDLSSLIPDSVSIRLGDGTPQEDAHQLAEAAGSRLSTVVVDAVTNADLDRLAAALGELGPWAVPVGSAGLATTLASRWGVAAGLSGSAQQTNRSDGKILIVVSSLHDTSRTQADRLIEDYPATSLLVLRPGLREVKDRTSALAWADQQGLGTIPQVTMLLSPADRPVTNGALNLSGGRIADALAAIAGSVLEHSDTAALILMGGDGARAVLRETAAQSIVVSGALQEGVPVGVVDGGRADGLQVVTKAGGFGTPDSLLDIVHQLLHPSSSTEARP